MKKLFLAAAVLILLTAAQSHARPGDPARQFGCGRNTVSAGDPADKVITQCGSPTSVQARDSSNVQLYSRNSGRVDTHVSEDWTYNFGPRGGMVQMTFRDGILIAIKDKGAGY